MMDSPIGSDELLNSSLAREVLARPDTSPELRQLLLTWSERPYAAADHDLTLLSAIYAGAYNDHHGSRLRAGSLWDRTWAWLQLGLSAHQRLGIIVLAQVAIVAAIHRSALIGPADLLLSVCGVAACFGVVQLFRRDVSDPTVIVASRSDEA